MNRALLALLAAAAILFFTGLGRATLFDQDEAKYTQVAREILQTGDPITLHVNGRPWFVHPPLYIWLVAATGWLFGFSEFTARVWSAVFGLVGIYAAYLLGRRLFTARAALLAAAVLPAMFQFFAHARLAVFDGALTAFMLLAFYAFLEARAGRRAHAYCAAVWAGLGTLTKGPIALLLPALIAAAFLLLGWIRAAARRLPEASTVPAAGAIPVLGPILVYAALAVPWYLIEWMRHGWPFVQTVIGYYTVNRFVGVVEGQSGPWWYYAPVFGLGAFPWTAFLLAMVPYHLRRWREEGSLLVLLWTGITIAFYTAAGTKLPNYVLPVYPWAALGIAAMWDGALDGERAARIAIGSAIAGTVIALVVFAGEIVAFAGVKYPADLVALQRHLMLVAAILGVWLFTAAVCYALRRPVVSFALIAASTWLLGGILVFRTLPLIDARRPVKAVAAVVRSRLTPDALLVGYRINDHQTLLFYANHRVQWVEDVPSMLPLICTHPATIVVSRPSDLRAAARSLEASGNLQLRPLIDTDTLAAVEVTCGP